MNKWKIGFWIYFTISVMIIFYFFSKSNFYKVDLAFTTIEKRLLEKDLSSLSGILDDKNDSTTENINEKKDTIVLEKIILIFKSDKLIKIDFRKDIFKSEN